MSESNRESESRGEGRSPAEWVTFGVSLSVVATIAGLVIWDWLTVRDAPPVVAVERDGDIRAEGGQFYVPFKVTNTGGSTAESVQVVAELRVGGSVGEGGEQEFDFLSGGETERGEFVFSRPPNAGELRLRVAGYKLP